MLISPLKTFLWKKNLCFRNTQSAQMSIRQSIIHIYIYIYNIYTFIFIYIYIYITLKSPLKIRKIRNITG